MEGELKPLSDTNAYNPSYDVAMLPAYDFDQLDLIKLEIESDLHILSQKLEAVSTLYFHFRGRLLF